MISLDAFLSAGRSVVRLYTTGRVSAAVCDVCAAQREFEANGAPLIPLLGCSVCGALNIHKLLPPGYDYAVEVRDAHG